MKPEGWTPNTVDAIATGTPDGRRIVLKAVNYAATTNTLLTRLQGKAVRTNGTVTLATITAPLNATRSRRSKGHSPFSAIWRLRFHLSPSLWLRSNSSELNHSQS